jgi:hypothetical protein
MIRKRKDLARGESDDGPLHACLVMMLWFTCGAEN